VANWEGLALCEDYQTKGHGTKGKQTMDFKKSFSLLSYPNFKKDAIFGHFQLHKLFRDL